MPRENIILLSDLHLTSAPADEYRFGIFEWLQGQIVDRDVGLVLIGGDLTDRKDNHPADLANSIVEELAGLNSTGANVVVMKGNHDYLDPNCPYFRFLNYVNDLTFVTNPVTLEFNGNNILLLPHTRTPTSDWKDLIQDIESPDTHMILLHQTIEGAKASNGMEMEGISSKMFAGANARCYSGDIHVPQKIGKVEYVGSPYRIHFGDSFDARCLLIGPDWQEDLHYPCLKKHTILIKDPEELRGLDCVSEGDQVKVRVQIPKSRFVEWPNIKKQVQEICEKLGLDSRGGVEVLELKRGRLHSEDSTDPATVLPSRKSAKEVFERFCTRERVAGYLKEVGKELL